MANSWKFMLKKSQLTCFLFDMNFHEYSMNFHKLHINHFCSSAYKIKHNIPYRQTFQARSLTRWEKRRTFAS